MAPMSPPLTGASSIVAPSDFGALGEAACGTRRDAAHVDDDGAWLKRAEDTVRAVEHQLHVR